MPKIVPCNQIRHHSRKRVNQNPRKSSETAESSLASRIVNFITNGTIIHALDESRLNREKQSRLGVVIYTVSNIIKKNILEVCIWYSISFLNNNSEPVRKYHMIDSVGFVDDVVAPLFEELVFRSLVQGIILNNFFQNKSVKIIVGNTGFALFHLFNLTYKPVDFVISQVAVHFLMPSYAIYYEGGGICNSILSHAINNLWYDALG